MTSLILFISADFLLHSGQEQHCLHLEKAFHWWEPLQSLSDANELNSGPDGSGNLLICHTTQHNANYNLHHHPVFSIFQFMAILGVLELNIIQAIYGTLTGSRDLYISSTSPWIGM